MHRSFGSETKVTRPKKYSITDLISFEPKQTYSTFGKPVLAVHKQAPKYVFGTPKMKKEPTKLFLREQVPVMRPSKVVGSILIMFLDPNGFEYCVSDKETGENIVEQKLTFNTSNRS
jgi:hypothetical protein